MELDLSAIEGAATCAPHMGELRFFDRKVRKATVQQVFLAKK
ncbi:hypothetical protein ABIA43_002384 [Bradyrhizobium sp. USDA 328]